MKVCTLNLLFLLTTWFAYANTRQSSAKTQVVFTQNAGQLKTPSGSIRNDIDYTLHTPGLDIFIGAGTLTYQWTRKTNERISNSFSTYRMDVSLAGCNNASQPVSEEILPYYENYFREGNAITAHTCKRILYRNIYPGIDWALYISASQTMEYDFIVHSGSNAADIRIQYNGAIQLALKQGALVAKTPYGNITEQAPYTFDAHTKRKISSSFCLHQNVLSFSVPKHNGDMVIDPELKWSTYYGDLGNESINEMISDHKGHIYIAGHTTSVANIATTGSFKNTISGNRDAFLAKFDEDGQMLWSTYYGGSDTDVFNSLAIDKYGFIYASGLSQSPDNIATANAFRKNIGASQFSAKAIDAFVVKFDSTGKRIWATYYGGREEETGGYVACDTDANVYIAGGTRSRDGIAANSIWRSTLINLHYDTPTHAGYNGFITKLDSGGHRLWGTYYGMDNTYINAIALDNNNNLYIGGTTFQADTITGHGKPDDSLSIITPDAYWKENTYVGSGFIVKIDARNKRLWGTFSSYITQIIPAADRLYIAGDGYQNRSGINCMLAATGKGGWGIGVDKGTCKMALINPAEIALVGYSDDTATYYKNNYQDRSAGLVDVFIEVIDSSGHLQGATFYGGESIDMAKGIVATSTGDIIIAGNTLSHTGISTSGSFKDYISAAPNDTVNYDGFLACFDMENISVPKLSFCPGDTIDFSINTEKSFNPANIFTIEMSDVFGKFTSPSIIGTKAATGSCTIRCPIPVNKEQAVDNYILRFRASNPAFTSFESPKNIKVLRAPGESTAANDGPYCSGSAINLSANSHFSGASFEWSGPGGYKAGGQFIRLDTAVTAARTGIYRVKAYFDNCIQEDTTSVTVYDRNAVLHPSSSGPVCTGDSFNLSAADTAIPGIRYFWSGPNRFTDTGRLVKIRNMHMEDAGLYTVETNISTCSHTNTTAKVFDDHHDLQLASNSPVFTGDAILLYVVCDTIGLQYTWSGPNGFRAAQQFPAIHDVSLKASGRYTVSGYVNYCYSAAGIDVVVIDKNTAIQFGPNPGKGIFTYVVHVLQDQEIPITISDLSGRKVFQDIIATSGKTANKAITLTHLADGIYYLHSEVDGKPVAIPFLLSR